VATYTIRGRYLRDNHAVVELLTASELAVGGSITVAGLGAPFVGTFTIEALPTYLFLGVDDEGDLLYDYDVPLLNQVLYARTADDVDRAAGSGTLTYSPVCTWISAADLTTYLNIPAASAADTTLITQAAAASSQFCYRRRQEAGYVDSLTTVPSADVKLAALMYGGACYRSRGSIGDTFASFDQMGGAVPQVGLGPMVKQLLGVDRPAVA